MISKYYIYIYIYIYSFEGLEMIKALIYTTDETTHIWYIQFITLFAQALFKGAVDNLFSFMSNMSFGFDTLPIGFRILQYQRRLYILGVTQTNQRANQGKNILTALAHYHKINAKEVDNEIENIILEQMEQTFKKIMKMYLEEDFSDEPSLPTTNTQKTEEVLGINLNNTYANTSSLGN